MSNPQRQQQQQQQRKEPWRNNSERHYCAICNAWMSSDRPSILLHENGKKHLENQKKVRQQKRQEKQKEEEQQSFLQKSLQQMEQAAIQSHLQQDHLVASSLLRPPFPTTYSTFPPPPTVPSSNLQQQQQQQPPPSSQFSKKEIKQEKEQWKKRRKQRENDKGDQDESIPKSNKKRRIEPDEGHYEYNGKIYLEGLVFGELLEEEMPVQLWTGSPLASLQEKKLAERDMYWKNALIVAVGNEKAHVAYLASPNDVDETVEKNMPLDRIRIILGADESIPDTLEEARLMAMGGEEIQLVPSGEASSNNNTAPIDEATGLSSWSTVAIKRTTVRQEVKEERKRIREKRKQEKAEQDAKEKEMAARKMEEAKAANADDSALGSIYFAELGGEVQGYKGVDISDTGDDKLTIQDTAKSLAAGKVSVGFKKRVKKPMANRSQRTTSADDE